MNQLTTAPQTPIEIALQVDGEGRTTARKLYDFLGLAKGQFSRWCKMNILENAFAENEVDFWGFDIDVEGKNGVYDTHVENSKVGRPTTDYKLTASFAKKLAMGCHNSKGEQARNYFIAVEDKLKEIATSKPVSNLDISALSPTTQALIQVETRQNQQAAEIQEIKNEVQIVKEQITPNVKLAPVQTELALAADIYGKTMRKDRISTERVAAMYCVGSRAFYDTLHKLGIVVPASIRGWKLSEEYENKGIGFSQNQSQEYAHVAWSPKGVKLIKDMLKNNGVTPTKRLPQKKKIKSRKGLI